MQKTPDPQKQNDFTKLTAFDKAMRKIVATPKAEVERREQAERDAKASSK